MTRVLVDREIAVATRDGVELATDVYRPDGEGPRPTLVYRIRGSRSSAFIVGQLMLNPLDAVRRGYAVAIQEVRGRAGSQARWHPFVHEREDGEDCLAWVLEQPWCDGRLGVYGTAYSAETALALAASGRDEIRAVAVLGTGADYHDGWVFTSGAFELGWNVYWAYMTVTESIERLEVGDAERDELRREHARAIIEAPAVAARLPLTDHPLLRRCGEDQFHEWLAHPDYDEYWASVDVLASIESIAAPVLSIVGWHDNFLKSHFDLYRAVTRRGREPGRSHHRLVVGPWEHVNYVSPFATGRTGAVEFGPRGGLRRGAVGPPAAGLVRPLAEGGGQRSGRGRPLLAAGPGRVARGRELAARARRAALASTLRRRRQLGRRRRGAERRYAAAGLPRRLLPLRPSRPGPDGGGKDADADDHGRGDRGPVRGRAA